MGSKRGVAFSRAISIYMSWGRMDLGTRIDKKVSDFFLYGRGNIFAFGGRKE